MIKSLSTAISIAALALFVSQANAADAAKPAEAKTAQQEKMKTCNKDATGKKGAERKAFMKECLSGGKAETAKPEAKAEAKPAADAAKPAEAKTAQQEKMKTCNKDATGKKGAERKAFMKDCLSKK